MEVFCKKKVSLKISQACNFVKKRLQHSCFSVKSLQFLRTPISKNTSKRLLLNKVASANSNARIKGHENFFSLLEIFDNFLETRHVRSES